MRRKINKMSKYYFEKEDSEFCWTRQYFIDQMEGLKISEMKVFEAVPVKSSDTEYIFCVEALASGDKGNCGKLCANYIPRNGKSGICKYHIRTYEAGKEVTIKIK